MQGKITKRLVDSAKVGDRDTFYWDSETRGFGLKITPSGRRVYILQYRVGGRRASARRVTIGLHGAPWTPETARREAQRLHGDIARGRDPAAERAANRD